MVNRRIVIAAAAALPLFTLTGGQILAQDSSALSGNSIPTADGDMIIHPVQHASLVIGFGAQVIYVDPVGGAGAYQGLPAPTAILITHGHGDHFDVPTLEAIAGTAPILTNQDVFDKLPAALKAHATAIANGAQTELAGLPVRAIAAYNITADRLRYHPKGVGNGYVLTLGDKLVYIAGDTEPTPDMLGLSDIEVAFVPMNLPYTMTQEQAAEAVNAFKPRIVYPYHYSGDDLAVFVGAVGAQSEVRRAKWY
jgi:L-ascorbate metabolism protein UlaG (beta-lactamase superfamily)